MAHGGPPSLDEFAEWMQHGNTIRFPGRFPRPPPPGPAYGRGNGPRPPAPWFPDCQRPPPRFAGRGHPDWQRPPPFAGPGPRHAGPRMPLHAAGNRPVMRGKSCNRDHAVTLPGVLQTNVGHSNIV